MPLPIHVEVIINELLDSFRKTDIITERTATNCIKLYFEKSKYLDDGKLLNKLMKLIEIIENKYHLKNENLHVSLNGPSVFYNMTKYQNLFAKSNYHEIELSII